MSPRAFVKEFKREFERDNIGDLAAMLTYYAVFALFPFALFVVSVTLLVLPTETLQDGIAMLTKTMPHDAAALIAQQVTRMEQATTGGVAVLGILLSLWGASRATLALGRALNSMHEVKETRSWIRLQLTAIAVTLVVSVLTIVALGLLVFGPVVGHFVADRFGLGGAFDVVWAIGRWIGACALVMLVWAILLYALPNLRRPFRWVTPGAMTGVVVWLVGSQLFALYVSNFGKYEKTYGALGVVIIFLTWLWLSSFALLLGGEVDDVLDDERRARTGEPAPLGKDGRVVTRGPEGARPGLATNAEARGALAPGNYDKEINVDERRESLAPYDAGAHGVGDLAKRLTDDLSTLARDHVELAKVELKKSAQHAAADGAAVLLGGIVALIGFAMLCVTAVVALAPVLPPLWLRMLIMSLVYLLAGGGVAAAFVHRLKGDTPDLSATKSEASRTARVLKEQVTHG